MVAKYEIQPILLLCIHAFLIKQAAYLYFNKCCNLFLKGAVAEASSYCRLYSLCDVVLEQTQRYAPTHKLIFSKVGSSVTVFQDMLPIVSHRERQSKALTSASVRTSLWILCDGLVGVAWDLMNYFIREL